MTKLITLEETARYLRKTETQMRWMRYNGTGPKSAKIGGRIMYRQEDVEAYIEECFDRAA